MLHVSAFRRAAALLGLLLFSADIQAQKVGIGTTTPDSTLTVAGGARFRYGVQVGDYTLPAQKGAPGELLLTDPTGGAALRWSSGLRFTPGLGLITGANQPLAPATVGTPNTTNIEPFGGQFTDLRMLTLLTAADLTAAGLTAGPLLALDLEVTTKNSTQPYQGFTVKLGATALTALGTGAFPPDPLATVYSGPYTTALGWNSLPFSQAFVWDGTSNLLVQTCFDNVALSSFDEVRQRTTPYVAMQRAFSTTNAFGGCVAPTGTPASRVPIYRFTPGTRGYVLPATAPLPGQVLVGGPAAGSGPDPALWTSGLAYTPGAGLTVGDPAFPTVVVGTQNQTQADPFSAGPVTDARYQYLLLASELTAAGVRPGPLTSVATQTITKNTTGSFNNVVVKVGTTALSALADGPFAAGLTTVYTGTYTTTVGWNEVPFAQPFVWDGTSNLLLQYCFDNAATVGPFDVVAHRSTAYLAQLLATSPFPGSVGCALAAGFAQARMPVFRFATTQVPYTLPAAGGTPNQVLTQTAVGQTAWRDLPWLRTGATNLYRPTGKVGIGTAAPDSTLTVQGGAHFTAGVQVGDYVLPARRGNPGELLQTSPTGAAALTWAEGLNYAPTTGLTLGANQPLAPVAVGTNDIDAAEPFMGQFTDARHLTLLLAADLTAAGLRAGPLLGVELEVIAKFSAQPYQGFTVKLGATALPALVAGTFPPDPLTTVYSGSYTTVLGWNNLPFRQPFVWDGTSNLLVQTCFDNATTSGLDIVHQRTTPYVAGQLAISGSNAIVGCTAPYSNSTLSRVPIYRFTPGSRGYTLPAAAPAPGQLLVGGAVGTTSAPDPAQFSGGLTYTPATGLTIGGGQASAPLTVGTATGTRPEPFLGAQADARTVVLLTAADLAAAGLPAGPLTGLALNVIIKNSTQPYQGFTVRLSHTALTTLTGGTLPTAAATTVHTSAHTTAVGWNTLPFSQPFNWDGTSNLLVQFCFDNPTTSNFDAVSTRPVAYNGMQVGIGGTNGCAITAVAMTVTQVPIVRFARGTAYTLPPLAGTAGQVLTQQATGLALWDDLPWLRTGTGLADIYRPTGRVGIGTATPRGPLDVDGPGDVYLVDNPDNGNGQSIFLPGHLWLAPFSGTTGQTYIQARVPTPTAATNLGITFRTTNAGVSTDAVRFNANGQAEFFGGAALTGNFAYFAYNGASAVTGTGTNPPNVSIRANGRVVATEFNATSDRRLKTVVGLTDNAADLALVNQLRITNYEMRDRATFGNRRFKKVIAQEVEAIFPQAVHQQTGFLPDVYAVATGARTEADSLLTLTLPAALPEGATVGQRLKLIGPAGEVIGTVARAAAPGATRLTVRGAQTLAATPTEIFVFGLEHPDVRAVDYEALSMLNVSATQELARKIATLEAQNAQLRQQAGRAETRATAAEAATTSFEQRLRELETRLGTATAR